MKQFGIGVTGYDRLEQLEARNRRADDLDLILELPVRHAAELMKTLRNSRSQYRQDLFVLSELDFKVNGFFVEFGATNGVDLSNTYLLEKDFGWNGILAEPARRWHADLLSNRTCSIEKACVWRESRLKLKFNETDQGEISTIYSFNSSDHYVGNRKRGVTYSVETISLEAMLDKYKAPKWIDYLSIDTEGSEYDILSVFDFDKYAFRVITVEHNFTQNREKIFGLLTRHGYVRKLESMSKCDDWYVKVE
jgi:FkbM family methyltransferase